MTSAPLLDPPAAVAKADTPAEPRCANCGAIAGDAYCPRCGQEQHDVHRSVRGLLAELLDAFAGWDGKIPATVRLLVVRPGALTVEFLAGRRARYVRPLRLYLLTSVLFFVAMRAPSGGAWFGGRPSAGADTARARRDDTPPQGAAAGGRRSAVRFGAGARAPNDSSLGARIERAFDAKAAAVRRLPQSQRDRVLRNAMLQRVGNALFVLVPLFALLLRVLYLRAPLFYVEHGVFALHVHAQAMLAIALAHVTGGALATVAELWAPAYLLLAMRRVYGAHDRSRWRTALKFGALVATYGAVLFAALLVTLFVALLDIG